MCRGASHEPAAATIIIIIVMKAALIRVIHHFSCEKIKGDVRYSLFKYSRLRYDTSMV